MCLEEYIVERKYEIALKREHIYSILHQENKKISSSLLANFFQCCSLCLLFQIGTATNYNLLQTFYICSTELVRHLGVRYTKSQNISYDILNVKFINDDRRRACATFYLSCFKIWQIINLNLQRYKISLNVKYYF